MRGTLLDEAIRTQDPYILANSSPEGNWNLTRQASHEIKDMVLDCSFNGEPCSYKNFSQFYWKQGEKCFTFNDGQSARGALNVSNAGWRNSLQLTINIQHYDYYRDRSKAGIHLILHDQFETPVRIEGPRISPGFSTHVQLKEKKYVNLPSPYATNCGTKKLKFFNMYSMNLCWLDSVTQHVQNTCGCKDYFMPGHEIPVCGIFQFMNCTWPQWEEHDTRKTFHCPLACNIKTYGNKLSSSVFPSHAHAQHIMQKFDVLREAFKNSTGKQRTEVEFLRDTLLRLVIYFDDLSYELIEQRPSYDTLKWLGDVGGTLGLFVGVGAMTCAEFFDCVAMVIHTFFFEKLTKDGTRMYGGF